MRAEDVFETVTADLIAAIETGADDWRMPWHTFTGLPRNLDGRAYRGINALVLAMTAAAHGWCGRFATYRAIQQHGGQVRRGEHGTTVVLWKPTDRPNPAEPADPTGEPVSRGRLVARTFTVFAVEQADGLPSVAPVEVDPVARLVDADRYFTAVGATVRVGGDRACYSPGSDVILLPGFDRFERAEDFYATSSHEHVHWTGHPSRLGRDLSGRFGDRAYAGEELIAELGAAFWCAQFGLLPVTRADHAAYLAGWLGLLGADPRALVTVCSHAQRALVHLNTLAGRSQAGCEGVDSDV